MDAVMESRAMDQEIFEVTLRLSRAEAVGLASYMGLVRHYVTKHEGWDQSAESLVLYVAHVLGNPLETVYPEIFGRTE